MKKFVAVLLPIILIGSLAMGFAVSAAPCPVDDPDARWDHVARNQLPQLRYPVPLAQGYDFLICPWDSGRIHPTGATRMRSTPAGRAGEYAENHVVTIPAGQMVTSTGQDGFFAWTMACNSDVWIHVEWRRYATVAGVRTLVGVYQGYMHSRQLRPWGSTCP